MNKRDVAGDITPNDSNSGVEVEFAIVEAAQDIGIQGLMRLFMVHDVDEASEQLMRDGLEEIIERAYNVPRERSEEVFSKAEDLVIYRELELYGQA